MKFKHAEVETKIPYDESVLKKRSIKPINGFEGYYIDKIGNIYSRWINKARHGVVLGDKLKKLKPKIIKSGGHYSISLGRAHQRLIHRLVYETFVGAIPPGMVVRHLNDIPSDNRIENLAIGTQKDNVHDCIRNGHHKTNAKLDSSQYKQIMELKEKLTWKQIADMYSVNEKTVRRHIKKYKKEKEGIA